MNQKGIETGADVKSYGQYCSIVRASELLANRLREPEASGVRSRRGT